MIQQRDKKQRGEVIQLEDVTVERSGILALDSISFSIQKGEYVGLLGPNGAGKTTLFLTILGLIKPNSGDIFLSPEAHIGYVPQKYLPNTSFPVSVEEIVSMGFHQNHIWSKRREKEKIYTALESVSLGVSYGKRNFSMLSGGQKQRVIIARSLVHNPNLLLFDEPTSGIDHATKIQIYELLARLNKEKGITILFASHEVEHVVRSCRRVLCLDRHLHDGCHPRAFSEGNREEGRESLVSEIIPIHHTRQPQTKHKRHESFYNIPKI